jgi:endonuclease YncB( thermonuclease family)
VVVAILAAASLGGWWLGAQRRTATAEYRVIAVVDGDTIEVRDSEGHTDTVRLLGVDTPETRHPDRPVECFGPEAAAYTRRRTPGGVSPDGSCASSVTSKRATGTGAGSPM